MSLSSSTRRPGGTAGPDAVPRVRSRMPVKVVVGALSALLLFGSATHLLPAMKAGLHDGTHGLWVAATKKCVRSACTWSGKFVSPGGHVLLTSAQFDGRMPADVHAGSSVAALFTGSSGLVFPASGSDLWISLLVAIVVSAFGLYWSSHRVVANYFRQRRSAAG